MIHAAEAAPDIQARSMTTIGISRGGSWGEPGGRPRGAGDDMVMGLPPGASLPRGPVRDQAL